MIICTKEMGYNYSKVAKQVILNTLEDISPKKT